MDPHPPFFLGPCFRQAPILVWSPNSVGRFFVRVCCWRTSRLRLLRTAPCIGTAQQDQGPRTEVRAARAEHRDALAHTPCPCNADWVLGTFALRPSNHGPRTLRSGQCGGLWAGGSRCTVRGVRGLVLRSLRTDRGSLSTLPASSNLVCPATCTSQTRDEVPDGAFFLFVSKGFNDAIRLSETGRWPEIGLRTPRVSFHPPFTQIETHSKMFVFSGACRK